MNLSEMKPDKSVDVKGQVCPYSLIETRNALEQLAEGELLEILTDNEASAKETIPMLCGKKGFPCESISDGDVWRVLIQKVKKA